ncbi:hypothetical protein FQN54_003738 [Arachnomyces sp. PD_36]|nr:hypothetical protein FQN54_003738 [Arachnomyces sp. PD_36]
MALNLERHDGSTVDIAAAGRSSRLSSVSATPAEDNHEPRPLSTFERVISTHAPILESLLLQSPTDTIFQLYHTSPYLRSFLRSYPTAWKHLSFRLLYPSGSQMRPMVIPGLDPATQRQSRPYALDQLLLTVILPFSPCLKSLELDNTAVSGQILTSTVLNLRRETLEHLSVRGCKNVSLKYHIIPYLTMFGLQYDADMEKKVGTSPATKQLALKSLYTYRCRHHRRRPYLSSSLLRRDSDSEPTHELVNLCHKLGIWTDTAWCTTPAGRCFRRKGYVSMRVPQGAPEVWVVFDRLWRSKNWIGPIADRGGAPPQRDGRIWEHDETGCYGEALGTGEDQEYGEGKTAPAHLRRSHQSFVQNIKCDLCLEDISERCEQCSVLMHCVGCRKTLCASCAFERPYPRRKTKFLTDITTEKFWWAPGATTSPCVMQEPPSANAPNMATLDPTLQTPLLKFYWCCTEPMFSGGGGISTGAPSREIDRLRAAPLPRGQGWEDPEYSTNEWSKTFPKYAYGDPGHPDYTLATGHAEMMRWLLGPPGNQPSTCPRNLCQECFDSPQWRVHCKSCSRPLCMKHDLRGLRLRICGYKDLNVEKMAFRNKPPPSPATTATKIEEAVQPKDEEDFALAGPSNSGGDANDNAAGSDQTSLDNPSYAPIDGTHTGLQSIIDQTSASLQAQGIAPIGSFSNSNGSRVSSPASTYFETSTEAPKWLGCQSFFCPQSRVVGDQRLRCATVLQECTACSIYVCTDCTKENPPCQCSYCDNNYLCPNCLHLKQRDGTCRRFEEERMMKEEKWKRDMEMLESILDRNLANEVAGFAGQFFGNLAVTGGYDDDGVYVDDSTNELDDASEAS